MKTTRTILMTALIALIAGNSGAVGVLFDEATFPPRNGGYESQNGTGFGVSGLKLNTLNLTQNDRRVSDLPSPGETFIVDSFFDVFFDITYAPQGNVAHSVTVDSFFDVFTEITLKATGNSTGSWDTEMLSMDLSGSIPGGPTIAIRLSEAKSSGGQLTVSNIGSSGQDLFLIDSFFDVWTEISIDSGQWTPADSPVRVDLVTPEPASAVLIALGIPLAARRRKRLV